MAIDKLIVNDFFASAALYGPRLSTWPSQSALLPSLMPSLPGSQKGGANAFLSWDQQAKDQGSYR